MIKLKSDALIEKYNVPVPRYTSYPTVPYWEEGMSDTLVGVNSSIKHR